MELTHNVHTQVVPFVFWVTSLLMNYVLFVYKQQVASKFEPENLQLFLTPTGSIFSQVHDATDVS